MVTVRVARGRLLKLADRLETWPRKRFDFTTFVGMDWGGDPDLSCGAVACALGIATTMPIFRRLGLYLSPGGELLTRNDKNPWYLLGLDYEQHKALFFPQESGLGTDATPKQVARHIRKKVNEWFPVKKRKAAR
jgi:hypothetical protein